jgi:hypothetical protein
MKWMVGLMINGILSGKSPCHSMTGVPQVLHFLLPGGLLWLPGIAVKVLPFSFFLLPSLAQVWSNSSVLR